MPLAGLVRLRKHQGGRQATFGTAVAAKRAYGVTGVPDVNLNITDPEVDTGSIDVTATPHREAGEFTETWEFPSLEYNDIDAILSAFFGGGDVPTGAGDAKTLTTHPASVAPLDEEDFWTNQFGDDVLTDWFQLRDGIAESFNISGPDGPGVCTASIGWRYGSAASTGSTDSPVSGTVPTPGLSVDIAGVKVYRKDLSIFIADDPADLEYNQILHALHSFELSGTKEIDEKRWADGTQSFDADAIGVTSRAITFRATYAKTADIVGVGSEADHWFSDEIVNRYIRLQFTSLVDAEYDVPYSFKIDMPIRYYTREDAESGGNSVVVLEGHAFYDPDLFNGIWDSVLVNTLPAGSI